MRKRNRILRRKVFERDNYTCKKCSLQDREMRQIEGHHVVPLWKGGKNDIDNMITLCSDCHRFVPETKKEFEEYMEEECEGTLTNLVKAFKKAIKEHPELVEEINKEYGGKNF